MRNTVWWLIAGLSFAVVTGSAHGDDTHAGHEHAQAPVRKPRVFLDKSPRIVAYQLNRLSNAQLLLVDRSTDDAIYKPVYEAILVRPGMSRHDREEAADALEVLNGSDLVTELLAAAGPLDVSDRNGTLVLKELATMLLTRPGGELADKREALDRAVAGGQDGLRRLAYAALVVSGRADRAARLAAQHETGRLDLLAGISLIPRGEARASLRDYVVSCLDDAHSFEIRQAATLALAYIPARPADNFKLVAGLVGLPELRSAAVDTLLQIPKEAWPPEEGRRLVETLIHYGRATPPARRTRNDFLDAMQLADQLLAILPVGLSREYREVLESIAVRVIRINTVQEEMRYDTRYFAVEAGRPVQLLLRNEDLMPHNLVITAPGALREVAELAGGMTPESDSQGRQYIPDSDKVLFATRMVQAERQVRLTFTPPAEPGEYPYVCTFPRHWMRMNGVMVVVKDLDAWLENPQEPADPLGSNRAFVRSWTIEDLQGELSNATAGRHFEVGQRLFKEATCLQCHKMRAEGGAVGPELTEAFQRWKGDRHGVLREILEPSHKVEAKYAVHIIVTVDGLVMSGVVTEQNSDSITVVVNPESPTPQVLKRDDIDELTKTSTSMMPKGLMDRFTKDEIFELLAYLEAAGDPANEVFAEVGPQ